MIRDVQSGLWDDILIEDSELFFSAFGDDVATYYRTQISPDISLDEDFEHPSRELLQKIYSIGKKDLNKCRRREKKNDFEDRQIYHEFKVNQNFRRGFVLQAMSSYIINRETY